MRLFFFLAVINAAQCGAMLDRSSHHSVAIVMYSHNRFRGVQTELSCVLLAQTPASRSTMHDVVLSEINICQFAGRKIDEVVLVVYHSKGLLNALKDLARPLTV